MYTFACTVIEIIENWYSVGRGEERRGEERSGWGRVGSGGVGSSGLGCGEWSGVRSGGMGSLFQVPGTRSQVLGPRPGGQAPGPFHEVLCLGTCDPGLGPRSRSPALRVICADNMIHKHNCTNKKKRGARSRNSSKLLPTIRLIPIIPQPNNLLH